MKKLVETEILPKIGLSKINKKHFLWKINGQMDSTLLQSTIKKNVDMLASFLLSCINLEICLYDKL